jgi:hypothetical protein
MPPARAVASGTRVTGGIVQDAVKPQAPRSAAVSAASAGGAPPAVVKEYIENQKRPD